MAHPYASHKQSKVERSRVGKIAGHASGGSVKSDAGSAIMRKARAQRDGLAIVGEYPQDRMDKPRRAKGGRVGKTNVNVIIAGPQGAPAPAAGAGALPPVPPPAPAPRPPMPPPGAPMGGPPPGPPMPPRSQGGRAYARGGAVKDGPAYKEGRRLGTQVQHTDGKNDLSDIGRKRVVTYKTGGPVEAPKGNAGMGPKLPGGARGGLARLAKEKRAERKR